jgi:hypothetical protein
VTLPAPNTDATAIFHACLSNLARMVQADTGPANGTHAWEQTARTAIRTGLPTRDTLDERLFHALINAGVYDPDPSANAQFIRPAIASFGRQRVQTALLEFLRHGTNPERAGAARAWYWTRASQKYVEHKRAEWDRLANLRAEWRNAALRECISNEDIDVRRCILPRLPLSIERYPR